MGRSPAEPLAAFRIPAIQTGQATIHNYDSLGVTLDAQLRVVWEAGAFFACG